MRLKVKIENTYSDGYESESIEIIDNVPTGDIEAMWDYLYEFTGDGHGIGKDIDSYYEMTILEADDPALVGLSNEWG